MDTPPPAPGTTTTTTVVVEKKSGMGCFGCGCLVLLVLLLLFGGLVGGVVYWAKSKFDALTSSAPSTVQTFDGGDAVYHTASDKMTAFDQALQQNKPASLHLNADEINTLIARNQDMARNNLHLFVAINGDKADMQVSVPTSMLPIGGMQGRYINGDIGFGLSFDPVSKTIDFTPNKIRMGEEEVPPDVLTAIQSQLGPALNQSLQNDPECKKVLDQAQAIEIKDGMLNIEIK